MSFPYVDVFLALLVVYMGYSVWSGLDSRYPIAAALVLLVVTAVIDATGNVAVANTLAEYVFFLLGAGVVLLLIDHVRDSRREAHATGTSAGPAQGKTAETAQPGKRTADQSLDGVEQQPVPIIDASGDQHEYDEEKRDAQPNWHEN